MKLRVLHLNSPLSLAGAERVLLTYLASHDSATFEVTVASFLNAKRMENSFTEAITHMPISFHPIPLSSLGMVSPVVETVKLIRQRKIDLVHSHGYRADVTAGLATAWTGIPAVSTVHGWTPCSWKLRIYEGIDRLVLRRFQRIFCVSREIMLDLAKKRFNPGRLIHMPNAIAADLQAGDASVPLKQELGLTADERIILSVGRLSPEKGLDRLVRSTKTIAAAHNAKLIVVGDGPMRGELEAIATEAGVAACTIFTGHRQDVARFYRNADLFVLPSLTEGVPMALLEALSFGVPVVASAVGGIPDIISHGESGLLVPPADGGKLAAAMNEVLTDTSLSERLQKSGRATVQRYCSAETWARNIESHYQALVTAGGRSK